MAASLVGRKEATTVDFLRHSTAFGAGETSYDSCFYVHALDYHWHRIDRQPFKVVEQPPSEAGVQDSGALPSTPEPRR